MQRNPILPGWRLWTWPWGPGYQGPRVNTVTGSPVLHVLRRGQTSRHGSRLGVRATAGLEGRGREQRCEPTLDGAGREQSSCQPSDDKRLEQLRVRSWNKPVLWEEARHSSIQSYREAALAGGGTLCSVTHCGIPHRGLHLAAAKDISGRLWTFFLSAQMK